MARSIKSDQRKGKSAKVRVEIFEREYNKWVWQWWNADKTVLYGRSTAVYSSLEHAALGAVSYYVRFIMPDRNI